MFRENASIFFSNPVKDYRSAVDWQGVETAYRLSADGVGETSFLDQINALVEHPETPQIESLVVGYWPPGRAHDPAAIIDALVARKDRLRGLLAIFLGDIAHDQLEMPRISNADVAPLLHAFPHLEVLRVRGGTDLRFSELRHDALRVLIVESAGLPRAVLEDIGACEFPSLVHLDLWLGSAQCGWDGTIKDLQPILDGGRFPRLRFLGLRHAEIANDLAAAIINADVLHQLRTLDLSSEHLTDVGARWLFSLPWTVRLRRLVLSRHAISDKMRGRLGREVVCKLVADRMHDPDDAVPLLPLPDLITQETQLDRSKG